MTIPSPPLLEIQPALKEWFGNSGRLVAYAARGKPPAEQMANRGSGPHERSAGFIPERTQ